MHISSKRNAHIFSFNISPTDATRSAWSTSKNRFVTLGCYTEPILEELLPVHSLTCGCFEDFGAFFCSLSLQ